MDDKSDDPQTSQTRPDYPHWHRWDNQKYTEGYLWKQAPMVTYGNRHRGLPMETGTEGYLWKQAPSIAWKPCPEVTVYIHIFTGDKVFIICNSIPN